MNRKLLIGSILGAMTTLAAASYANAAELSMADVDTDGDAKVTQVEWDAAAAGNESLPSFAEADKDASGDVSAEELTAATAQ